MLTTQPNKELYLQRVSLVGCVVGICSAFMYLAVLLAFVVHVFS